MILTELDALTLKGKVKSVLVLPAPNGAKVYCGLEERNLTVCNIEPLATGGWDLTESRIVKIDDVVARELHYFDSIKKVVVLTDSSLVVYDTLFSTKYCQLAVRDPHGVVCFEASESIKKGKKGGSKSAKQTVTYIGVGSGRNLLIHRMNAAGILDATATRKIELRDTPKAMVALKRTVFIGYNGRYSTVKRASSKSAVEEAMDQLNCKNSKQKPILVATGPNEVLVGVDSTASFMDNEGVATRRNLISFDSPAASMAASTPYIIGLVKDRLEVALGSTGAVLPTGLTVDKADKNRQLIGLTLQAKGAPDPTEAVLMFCNNQKLTLLAQTPTRQHVDLLVEQKRYALARQLMEELPLTAEEEEELGKDITVHMAAELFIAKDYKQAMSTFLESGCSPCLPISYYRGFLDQQFAMDIRQSYGIEKGQIDTDGSQISSVAPTALSALRELAEYLFMWNSQYGDNRETRTVTEEVLHTVHTARLMALALQIQFDNTPDTIISAMRTQVTLPGQMYDMSKIVPFMERQSLTDFIETLYFARGYHQQYLEKLLPAGKKADAEAMHRAEQYLVKLGSGPDAKCVEQMKRQGYDDTITADSSHYRSLFGTYGLRWINQLPEETQVDDIIRLLTAVPYDVPSLFPHEPFVPEDVRTLLGSTNQTVIWPIYLERITRTVTDTAYHTEYCIYLMDQFKNTGGNDTSRYETLMAFLKKSQHYDVAALTRQLPTITNHYYLMLRAQLHTRAGAHGEVLEIYVKQLADLALAEEYCQKTYDRDDGLTVDVFVTLVRKVYEAAAEAQVTGDADRAEELQTAGLGVVTRYHDTFKHATAFTRIIDIIPGTITLADVITFIRGNLGSLAYQSREKKLRRALCQSRHQNLSSEASEVGRDSVELDQDSPCSVCGAPLMSGSVAIDWATKKPRHSYDCSTDNGERERVDL